MFGVCVQVGLNLISFLLVSGDKLKQSVPFSYYIIYAKTVIGIRCGARTLSILVTNKCRGICICKAGAVSVPLICNLYIIICSSTLDFSVEIYFWISTYFLCLTQNPQMQGEGDSWNVTWLVSRKTQFTNKCRVINIWKSESLSEPNGFVSVNLNPCLSQTDLYLWIWIPVWAKQICICKSESMSEPDRFVSVNLNLYLCHRTYIFSFAYQFSIFQWKYICESPSFAVDLG